MNSMAVNSKRVETRCASTTTRFNVFFVSDREFIRGLEEGE